MGVREYTFENEGATWMVRVVDGGRSASLYRDGIWLMTVPLE